MADIQDDRLALINKWVAEGVFYKLESPGSVVRLWVTPYFNTADFDTKQKLVNVVYAYYLTQDSKNNLVTLYDSQTGKKLGSYSDGWGLKLN